jgi:putative ABC transport system permease protein
MRLPQMAVLGNMLVLSIRSGIQNLCAQWMRGSLSVLGLAVAVSSVIVVVALGAGAQLQIRKLVAQEGVNIIYVLSAARTIGGVTKTQQMGSTLSVQDAIDLQASLPQLREVCWWRQDPSRVIREHSNVLTKIMSISPGCHSVKGWRPEQGEEISSEHFDGGETVALIGDTVRRNLFGEIDPVGKTVRVKSVPFRIIGVLEAKGVAPGGYDQDDLVLIPYSTAKQKLLGALMSHVEVIAVATYDRNDLSHTAEEMKEMFRVRHRIGPGEPDDVVIRSQLEIEKIYEESNEVLTQFLAMIALTALVVGGIGIMNILLVSVTERTKEIGVRMAVGAKRRYILMQFLIEAMTISLVGGCLGIALGVVGARAMSVLVGWPTIISANTVAAAFVFSVSVGLFFGLYPANKAARLNPIDALRFE